MNKESFFKGVRNVVGAETYDKVKSRVDQVLEYFTEEVGVNVGFDYKDGRFTINGKNPEEYRAVFEKTGEEAKQFLGKLEEIIKSLSFDVSLDLRVKRKKRTDNPEE